MPWPKTSSILCTVRILYKGRAIKGLVVYYVVWLTPIKGMGIRTSAGHRPGYVVRMAIEQHLYRNKT